ncbi:unnamed protein product [Hymenolepis diminuta]|uniref:Uncharacterized protein n=1 Tax=Hymenolepis diminuta TaxID=6216 RepID=A0A564XX87_HYMDI|nr:unnamed protein product [Hymenolepis diminuta]
MEVSENAEDELATSRRKQHCHGSTDSLRTPEFVRRVHSIAWCKLNSYFI